MLTALMHITSSQPHACSSHTELVLYLQRSLCFIQKKKKTRSRAFSLCSWDNQDSCEDEDVRASHLKPDKTPAGVCRFFFRPVVERGLCDFLLCACRPHLLQTRSRDRISVWNVKIFIMTHFILYSTFKVFFFFFSFLSFSETGVWKSSCRGQNKICDFSVTRLISSSISLFYEEMFVWIDVKLQGHSAAG